MSEENIKVLTQKVELLTEENETLKKSKVRLDEIRQARNEAQRKYYKKRYEVDAEFREKMKQCRREYIKKRYHDDPVFKAKANAKRAELYRKTKANKTAV